MERAIQKFKSKHSIMAGFEPQAWQLSEALPIRVSMESNTQRPNHAQDLSVTINTSHPRSRLSIQCRLRQGRSATLDQNTLCLTAQLALEVGSKAGRSSPLLLGLWVSVSLQLAFSGTLSPSLEAARLRLLKPVLIWIFNAATIGGESVLSESLSRIGVKPPRFIARFYFSTSLMQTAFLLTASEPFLIHSIVGVSASLLSSLRFQLRDLAFQRIFLRYES